MLANRVGALMQYCLSSESLDDAIVVQSVVVTTTFHRGKLIESIPEIKDILDQMDSTFSRGGGWSFMNLVFDKNGVNWAEQRTADFLVALGLATGMVKFATPRNTWTFFPGSMPYLVIDSGVDAEQFVKDFVVAPEMWEFIGEARKIVT